MNQRNAADFDPASDDIFGRIASRYDLLCDLFSFCIHRLWKRKVARVLAQEKWSNLLDAAAGTGDIAKAIAEISKIGPEKQLVVSDISPKMLQIAEQRLEGLGDSIEIRVLDAECLTTYSSESFDAYSMSLGLKICNRKKALGEAYRVLKPGGRIVILEASNIPVGWLNWLYLQYMATCMPIIGWLATGGDSSAYKYLLEGIREFPTAEQLVHEMAAVGFSQVEFKRLSLGIVAIHTATKPNW